MKNYMISYRHTLGEASMLCYSWEVGSILRSLTLLALQGHQFSNVTINRV